MAVKREHEPLEGVNDTPPRMADLNATPSCGKENAETFHRLSALQVGKDSSPNTLAAEVAAIAGITALTQVIRVIHPNKVNGESQITQKRRWFA